MKQFTLPKIIKLFIIFFAVAATLKILLVGLSLIHI